MNINTCIRIVILPVLGASLLACTSAYTGPVMHGDGVVFRLHAPHARTVSIAGSFNQWSRDKDMLAGPDRDGWWSITLPLPPGRHEYLFLLDGREWVPDPYAMAVANDGLGGMNAVLFLVKP